MKIAKLLAGAAFLQMGATGAYAGEHCGQVKWMHGAGCADLKVIFDLSACGGSPNKVADVACQGNQATAHAETKGHQYEQKLALKDSGWVPVSEMAQARVGEKFPEEAPAPAPVKVAETAPPPARTPTSEEIAPVAVKAETPSEEKEPEKKELWGVQFSGLFDGYYQWNFNRPANSTPSTVGAAPATPLTTIPAGNTGYRVYDIYHNQLELNLAELEIRKKGEEVSFLADLDFGHEADINGQGLIPGTAVDDVSKYIGQAFVTYTPKWQPRLSFDFGKMVTHITYETTKATENWNYSRSMIFTYGVPLWHVGARAGYELLPEKLQLNFYVYNGWNTLYNPNTGKTYGAQLKFLPTKQLTLNYNFIGGPEQLNNDGNWRFVHELNGTFWFNHEFALAFEGVAGSESGVPLAGTPVNEHWTGLALYAKWQATERFYISPRAEAFRDDQGTLVLTNVPTTFTGYTLTNSLEIAHGLQTKLELRYDHVANGVATPYQSYVGPQAKQATATLGVVYEL